MQIGIIGYGVFGKAIEILLVTNGHTVECVDVHDTFTGKKEIIFLTVPVPYMRSALLEHKDFFDTQTIIVNCSKGIEVGTGALPHQIVAEVGGDTPYACVSGPSYASEIVAKKCTAVNIASKDKEVAQVVEKMLTTHWFVLEHIEGVFELELAGAMKNVYAIAAGYIAEKDSGKNLHAHLQVVALREYVQLVTCLGGKGEVIQPGVVGDLILTTGSEESRNYTYGYSLAQGKDVQELTAEGVATATAIQTLCQKNNCSLPLVDAVQSLIQVDSSAERLLFEALGF